MSDTGKLAILPAKSGRLGGSIWWSESWWWALIGATLLMRAAAMCAAPLEAHEAYYWMYSQHPNWGYFDHPPMVAWVIRAGTFLFGSTEIGVRIVGSLMMLGASVALYTFGRLWYGRRAGLLAAAGAAVLPVFFGNGFIATMDGPLVFFWVLVMLGVSLALRRDRPGWYYLAGAATGAALLCKYTGVFAGVGGFLAVIAHPRGRRHLLGPHPYLAFLLSLVMFAPVVAWNAGHEWASFRFQFLDRFAGKPIKLKLPLEFLLMQVGAATPVVLAGAGALLIWGAARRGRLLRPRWCIAMCFSMPLLLVMAYKSLRCSIHINWTLPAMAGLMPAAAKFILMTDRLARRRSAVRIGRRAILATGVCCVALDLGAAFLVLLAPPGNPVANVFGPWRELGQRVSDYELQLEAATGREPLIIGGDSYRTAALLAFYRSDAEKDEPPSAFTTSQWVIGGTGLGFEYWSKQSDWIGSPCVYVSKVGSDLTGVRRCFQRIETMDDARLGRLGYQVTLCYFYKGPLIASAGR